MALADKANQYVDSRKPWLLIKESDNEDEVQSICTTALNLSDYFNFTISYNSRVCKKISKFFRRRCIKLASHQ